MKMKEIIVNCLGRLGRFSSQSYLTRVYAQVSESFDPHRHVDYVESTTKIKNSRRS